MPHSTPDIRNVALAGHPGAGKTTLFEALLHAGGAVQTAGTIERGNTVSDHDPLERERGHSIDTAIASIDRDPTGGPGVHINLIDTPGYPEFRGPALSALDAVETVLVVVDAVAGVQHGTRHLMARAKERNLCRAIVVNRIDAEGADCARVLDQLRDEFGPEALPLNLPADRGATVVDCFGQAGGDSDLGGVAEWHRKTLDQVVEVNESTMDDYLELGEAALSADKLHAAFEQCLREGHLVPVCFASARTGVGIRKLLDVTTRLFPHPGEGNPPAFLQGGSSDARSLALSPDPAAHVVAYVFRIINDSFAGKLGVFRVYQGTVKKDSQLFVDEGRKPFKVGHLFRIQGKGRIGIDHAVPGDIARPLHGRIQPLRTGPGTDTGPAGRILASAPGRRLSDATLGHYRPSLRLRAGQRATRNRPHASHQGKMRCFSCFPIGVGRYMSYIPDADEIRPDLSTIHHGTGNMAKKAAKKATKKAAAKKATAKAAAPKAIKESLTKAGLVSHIAESTGLASKDVRAVLASLDDTIAGSLSKRGVGSFTLPGMLKITSVKVPAKPRRKGINPFTKEEQWFAAKPASVKVKVRPLKKLKDAAS